MWLIRKIGDVLEGIRLVYRFVPSPLTNDDSAYPSLSNKASARSCYRTG